MPSSAVRDIPQQHHAAQAPAVHPVPDRQGGSLLAADPDLRALLPLYLPPDLFNHLLPHLERMGALPAACSTSWPAWPTAIRPS
ncbi:hypothetical protein CBM2614_B30025 [Cupriavidus taiwanensis]|nr:hypothetical protein CBM2614_B30025 [Cupriavidus taiwanensis]